MYQIARNSKLADWLNTNLISSRDAQKYLNISKMQLFRYIKYGVVVVSCRYKNKLLFYLPDIEYLRNLTPKARKQLCTRCRRTFERGKKGRGRPCKES